MWVGERGPELMAMSGGERVWTHAKSMAMVSSAARSGGNSEGNVTVLMVTPDGALRRLPKQARPKARRFLAGD